MSGLCDGITKKLGVWRWSVHIVIPEQELLLKASLLIKKWMAFQCLYDSFHLLSQSVTVCSLATSFNGHIMRRLWMKYWHLVLYAGILREKLLLKTVCYMMISICEWLKVLVVL